MGTESRFRPRLRGVDRTGSGADYHYRDESKFYLAMEQAREYDRNDPIIGPGVGRVLNNVLQGGFTLDVQTGNDKLDQELTQRWNDWALEPFNCHIEQEFNFDRIAELVLRAALVDGDHFVLPLQEGSLQCVEAHRVRTPSSDRSKTVHGIKLDPNGVRTQYWITKEDLGTLSRPKVLADIVPYEAWDGDKKQVLQVYDPKRTSQRRGVSAFNGIADLAGMFDDLQFATLVKAQVASCFAIFRELSPGGDLNAPGQIGSNESDTRPDGTTRLIEGIGPGMELFGRMGEKLQGFAPNIPNAEFFPHSMLILTIIAINLGVPVAVLLLDPTKTNFSGWRGAIDEARKGFRRIQKWLRESLHEPVYEWKLRQWIAQDPSLGRARRGVNLFGYRWNTPTWSYIEPQKDIAANALEIRTMQTSPRRSAAARGLIFEEMLAELVEDNVMAIRLAKTAAKAINKEFSDDDSPVNWMQCLALPMPDGVSLNVPMNQEPETPEPAPVNDGK